MTGKQKGLIMKEKSVLVIGAGASGITAAIFAAREGAHVTVLEHNEKPGKKLCATGNGRCNLSNEKQNREAYRGEAPDFVNAIFAQFFLEDTRLFFENLGLALQSRNGYLYPRSNQAASVLSVLLMEAKRLSVKIKTREHVREIKRLAGGFSVLTDTWHYEADAVILASGSLAGNISGADGSGYALARSLGHSLIKPLPALVPLRCKGSKMKWAGVRAEGEAVLSIDGQATFRDRGELQLTEYGVSGIPIFQISRYAVRALERGQKVRLFLNFLPEYKKEEAMRFLKERREKFPQRSKKELLTGLFPEKLISFFCEQPELFKAVCELELEVVSAYSMESAQVCSGGIPGAEVHAETLESALVPGLFFAGEILNVDGACGGYNLQWAWSSGAVAGMWAAGHQERL